MWKRFRPRVRQVHQPADPQVVVDPPLQYIIIQGTHEQHLDALYPPRMPLDLFSLRPDQGVELEPYPSWTDPPPPSDVPSPPSSEPVTLSWPARTLPWGGRPAPSQLTRE